ncbi:MAG: winged helix-turn-helix transcriptional regulator [Gammaproteobacteria bacterium]|jgi:Lrp/AsnC family leucine-responsive transcriptional regulator|nr:winged helix-turn-helix transcriptional regulator [Gammaproteobacteria bacterium]
MAAKRSTSEARTLDRLDRRILDVLQRDGRISYVDLAERIGLSTSPCLERVRRLEREGFITGYHARVDPHRVGAKLLIYVEISLNYAAPDTFEQFRNAMRDFAEVQECHLVSGDFDFLLKLRVTDMAAYRGLLGRVLHHLPGAVRDSRTLVVMEEGDESLMVPIAG